MDTAQRSQHIKSCIGAHEKDMELPFGVQPNKDICGELMKANPGPTSHPLQLQPHPLSQVNSRWRRGKELESKVRKSNHVKLCDSKRVLGGGERGEAETQTDKEAMSNKHRYFGEGRGSCPFGEH